jgi:hypothetical protein
MDKQKLDNFKDTQFANIMIEWFNDEIKEMSDISKHKTWDEVLGKQYATEILKKMIRILEKKEEVKRVPNQYK